MMMAEEAKASCVEARILDAAKAVFMEKGYTDACMSEIAERVGMNRPALHYYFRTKDKLFQAVFGMIVEAIIPKFQDIITCKDLPLPVRVERIVDVYYSLLQENPYLPLFILREIDRDVDFLFKTLLSLKVGHLFDELKGCLLEEMRNGRLRRVPLRIIFLTFYYNPQIQISVVSGTKRSIFRQKNKTKRSKKKAAHNTYKAGAKG